MHLRHITSSIDIPSVKINFCTVKARVHSHRKTGYQTHSKHYKINNIFRAVTALFYLVHGPGLFPLEKIFCQIGKI